MHRVTRKYLLTSAANGSGAVAPGGVLLLLDPLPQLVPPRRQVPAGVQEALEGRPGSGVAEVVLRQLDPLLLQGVVLDQVAGDLPGLLGLGLREDRKSVV